MGSVRDVRVNVIGAGFAGLAAAVELAAGGHDVVVFEARDRVGGRVWSEELAGTVIERGAEFVLDGYDVMREWVTRLGLELAPTGMSYYVRESLGGPPVTIDEISAAGPAIDAAASAPSAVALSVTDLLAGLPISEGVRAAVAARTAISSAWPADDLSAATLCDTAQHLDARPTHRVSGGNQRVAIGLAARLTRAGGRLRLATPVRSVRVADAVTLCTDTGEHDSDAVVIAVPAAVLGDLVVEPAWPDWKHASIARTAHGQAAKLHAPLQDGRSPRTSAVLSVPNRYWCWTATDLGGNVPPVVNCFAGSQPALERLAVARGPDTWLDRLAELRPDLSLDRDRALLTTWHDDPWSRMAYAAHRVGTAPDTEALARPVGPLHFAGEHTDPECGGLMEGALRSGRRAAAEIEQLGSPPAKYPG